MGLLSCIEHSKGAKSLHNEIMAENVEKKFHWTKLNDLNFEVQFQVFKG